VAHESLADAFDRLGIRPMPSIEDLKAMTEDERRAAVAASSVSAAQFDQLPEWYREKLRRNAEETIARRDAEQSVAHRQVS
jgi:Fe-S cluster assembly scaffold protein SufB